MPKLHLVGITPDHRGLVLSEHARAKRGDMVLEIDTRLLEAIEKAQRLRTAGEGQRLESNALPSKRGEGNGENGVAVRLTPREIQQRLRAGETVAALARSSGTDEAWIQRFAAPVLAEKSIIIDRARAATFNKKGVGPSAAALGQAVAANVIDKGVPLTLPELEAGWGAYQHPQGGWHVTFTFPLRGRRQTAEWAVDPMTGELSARNKLGNELAWRESGEKLPQPKPATTKAPAKKQATTKAASPKAAEPDTAPQEAQQDAVQALPLTESAKDVPKESPKGKARPATSRARSTSKAPVIKRAAAAVTESAVDVVVDLREHDLDTSREPAPIGTPPAPQGGPPAL